MRLRSLSVTDILDINRKKLSKLINMT